MEIISNPTTITPDSIILSDEVSKAFKELRDIEDKDDPKRRDDLYGPYEALYLVRTGKLPPEYFEENDPEPWKLLLDEARRNILWQALFGCLDIGKEWPLTYIQLAIDTSLNADEFARELAKTNKQFLHSLDHKHNHHHHAMEHKISHIGCAGCSAVTGILTLEPSLRKKFENEIARLKTLSISDRMDWLQSQNLNIFANATVQDETSGIIMPHNS